MHLTVNTTLKITFAGALLGLTLAKALAVNLIVNGDFETGTFTGASFTRVAAGSNAITGWTVGGVAVDWHNSVEFKFPQSGSLVVDLNLDGGGPTGTLAQTFPTTIGANYELVFWLSGPGSNFGFSNPRNVLVNIAGLTQTFDAPASVNTALVWEKQQMTFTAVSASTTLMFSSPSGSSFWGPVIDTVSVTAVPEPATAVLFVIGVIGIAGSVRRRKRGPGSE